MWYRIELNKDRSVKTCVEVESSYKDGRSVHFIEADSREAAIAKLATQWSMINSKSKMRMRERTAARLANGLCARCREKSLPGKRLCEFHRLEQLRYKKASVTGESKKRKILKTDEDIAAFMLQRREKLNKAARARVRTSCTAATTIIKRYTEVLEAFDTMPPHRFRGWLTAKIQEQQDKIDAKRKAAGLQGARRAS